MGIFHERKIINMPCFQIKPHPKNAWQSPKNPLAHHKAKAISNQNVIGRKLYA
jgi:hypothetical protein